MLNPLGVLSAARDFWKDRRRPRIQRVTWEYHGGDVDRLMLRVLVVNHGHRKFRVTDAGTIHQGPHLGYMKAAHVDGVPLPLDDGEDGEILVFPLPLGMTRGVPPAQVWIGLATGKRTSAAVPETPEPSTGESGGAEY